MERQDASNSSVLADEIALADLDGLPRPFDIICQDLKQQGALSVDDFLSAPTDARILDVSFTFQDVLRTQPEDHAGEDADGADGSQLDATPTTSKSPSPRGMLNMLHQACQKVFGSSNALTFDYIEGDPQRKQCILTITRPNGVSRSYKSDATFARRGDAKFQAAAIAIQMGAIPFIITGETDAVKKKAALLNPADVEMDAADTGASVEVQRLVVDDEPVKQIVDCCEEWRAGLVQPHWVAFNDAKDRRKHGVALRIQLNAHVLRAYAVHPTYDNPKLAKVACARVAIEQGVLDFIRFGNGQTEPMKRDPENEAASIAPPRDKGAAKVLTLQQFYESLPQPFPEDFGDRSAQDINPPNWLNQAMQSAKGGRLTAEFVPVVDSTHHLHGCILRVERPEEVRTYLVDPHFPKRADARAAVCLLAMSQGFGDYCRQLRDEAAKRLPPEKKKLAFEKVMQTLSSECGKVRPGNRLQFRFTTEREAFGCVLTVDISPDAEKPDMREYSVPPEYGAKTDAKAAVACLAAEQGLVDLLRFKGGPLPEDYTPFWEAQANGNGDNYVGKRKDTERDVEPEPRHPKKVRRATRDNTPPDSVGRFKKNTRTPSDHHHQAPPKPAGPSRHREPQAYDGPPKEPAALRFKGHRRGASSMSYGQESSTSSAPPPPPYTHEHRSHYHHPVSYPSPPHPSSYPHPGPYAYHSPPPAQPMHFPAHPHPPPPPVPVAPVYPTYYPGSAPAPMMYSYPPHYPYSAPGYAMPPPPPVPYTSPYPPPAPVLYSSPPPAPPMAIPYAPPPVMHSVPYSPPYVVPQSPPGRSPHHYSMTYGSYDPTPPAEGYYPPPQPPYGDAHQHIPSPHPHLSSPPSHDRSPVSPHPYNYGRSPPHHGTQRPLPTGPAAMQGRSHQSHQSSPPGGPRKGHYHKGGQGGKARGGQSGHTPAQQVPHSR